METENESIPAQELAAEQQESALPKNVRQIGDIDKTSRIYIEDYVVTYLRGIAREKKNRFGAAALYGTTSFTDGIKNVFIVGAACFEEPEIPENGPSEEMLLFFKDTAQLYFSSLNSVGVAVLHRDQMRIPVAWHKKNILGSLLGRGEVFIDINTDEEESEYSFIHEDGIEIKDGHYIYYDKNDIMQDFMVEIHEKEHGRDAIDDRDEVIADSCKAVLDDRKENRRQGFVSFCVSASSIVLLIGMCAVLLSVYGRHNKSKETSAWNGAVSTVSQEALLEKTEEKHFVAEDSDKAYAKAEGEIPPDAPGQDAALDGMPSGDGLSSGREEMSLDDFIGLQNRDEAKEETADGGKEEDIAAEHAESPEAEEVSGTARAEDLQQDGPADYKKYKVAKGDTLYEICMRRYGSIKYMKDICVKNGIEDENNIYFGQILELPVE